MMAVESGREGCVNYLPIVPTASIYVPKVMHKPVMGGITMSETFTHMFLFGSARSFENWQLAKTVNLVRDGGVWEGRVR